MHRRDFLDPRHALGAAGPVLAALESDAAPDSGDVVLLRLGWRAMATRFEIAVPSDTPLACEAGREAFEWLDVLEQQLTVYRDSSEVSRLNANAGRRSVRVESRLFELLLEARRLWQGTD